MQGMKTFSNHAFCAFDGILGNKVEHPYKTRDETDGIRL
jgi:hypothetical protein